MERRVIARPAGKNESGMLAELTIIAGAGVFEYLLDDLLENMTAVELLAAYFRTDNPTYCWNNAVVAESMGNVAGMILAYPFREFKLEDDLVLTEDRQALIAVFNALPCPDSYYISAMAVYPEFRSLGAGGALLGYVVESAIDRRFKKLSLHVLEQNTEAVRLYHRHGFRETQKKLLPEISHLRYGGKVMLMERSL